jgi:RNA polymerase sigma-70 factor (ECF subfamily)
MEVAVTAALAEAHRREWAFVLAATIRVTRDLDLAEDVLVQHRRALGNRRGPIPRARPRRTTSS